MKKIILIAAATFFFAGYGKAQVQRKATTTRTIPNDSTRQNMRRQMSDMNLTQDQKTQMQELRKNAKTERDNIVNNASLSQDQKNQKLKDLRLSETQKMNTILTPDQQAKMRNYQGSMKMDDRKDTRKGKNNDDDFGKKYSKQIASLNLSQSQKDQLKPIVENAKKQRDDIKNDASLTKAQKDQKIKALKKEQIAKASAVLTPEQRTKAKAYLSNEKGGNKNQKISNGGKYQKTIESLNLSQAQKEQLKPMLQNAKQKRDAILKDNSLTATQKKAKMKDLENASKDQLQTVLTAEQKAQLKAQLQQAQKNKRQK